MRHVHSLRLSGLFVSAFLAACTTTMTVTPLREQPVPQVEDSEKVAIYDNRTEIDGLYEKIAVLEVSSAASKEKMLRDCQHRAAAVGANGILIERIGRHTESVWWAVGSVPVMMSDDAWDGRVLAIRVEAQ